MNTEQGYRARTKNKNTNKYDNKNNNKHKEHIRIPKIKNNNKEQ